MPLKIENGGGTLQQHGLAPLSQLSTHAVSKFPRNSKVEVPVSDAEEQCIV